MIAARATAQQRKRARSKPHSAPVNKATARSSAAAPIGTLRSSAISRKPSQAVRIVQEKNAMLTKEELPPCLVATTLMLIGNKWKIFIIQQLMDRPFRFSELRRAIPGISEKVLTDNLRAMEKDGIITRAVFPEVPPRTEYALSELGDTMRPIIGSMVTWGTGYQQLVREQ